MALLHMLHDREDLRLTVAHFDHGIRTDAAHDRKLVQEVTASYGLPFIYEEGKLGVFASEARARAARYHFLHQVRRQTGATAIVTSHHKDDVLETAVINLIRGTGRRGMTSLSSSTLIERPLLDFSKADLVAYALSHGLQWTEDSTNSDIKYTRNYVRHVLLSRFSSENKDDFYELIARQRAVNVEIDVILDMLVKTRTKSGVLDRGWFIGLPHSVSREVMAAWLRHNEITTFDKKMLERLVHAAKIQRVGQLTHVDAETVLRVHKDSLALEPFER